MKAAAFGAICGMFWQVYSLLQDIQARVKVIEAAYAGVCSDPDQEAVGEP